MSFSSNYFIGLFFILILASCDNSRSYSLEELENNHYNQLQMPVDEKFTVEQYNALFDELYSMNKEALLTRLSAKGLELHVASFGFYYLANEYVKEDDWAQAIKYHTIAANNYLNPHSLLKLAELNFFKEKNYAQAYEYLHTYLEVTVEITENNRSHPIAKSGKDKAQFMLETLEKLGSESAFDKTAVREKLKAELPPLLLTYREMYGLGPREGEEPS